MRESTAMELLSKVFASRVDKVMTLHSPMGIHAPQWCSYCSKGKPMSLWVEFPCQTIRILNGEQP